MTYPEPNWWKELYREFIAGNFHQFLLDGNIYDTFFWCFEGGDAGKLLNLKKFIAKRLTQSKPIIYFSSTTGILFYNIHDSFYLRENREADLNKLKQQLSRDLRIEGVPLSANQIHDTIMASLVKIEQVLTTVWKNENGEPTGIAVIIDHVDKIIPEMGSIAERHISERIKRWALDNDIKNNGNVIILIAENRENLPKEFHNDSAGTYPIRVTYPDADYRRLYFQNKRSEDNEFANYLKRDENHINIMVQLTKGFRLIDCERIVNILNNWKELSIFEGKENLDDKDIEDFVKDSKKETIASISKGMLEPIETDIQFDDIGGLEGVKEYLKTVADAIVKKEKDVKMSEIIPKGILLAGPPGTGKTLLAKALASESGISLVKMGDIRSKWVGESEKNMSLVLSLLKSMAPVVVFIDEIDQAIGSRSTGSGDSGVSGRIFGKILEFMGDNANRGDVIWIGATNRADLLDDAMIRRFDRVIPVVLPGCKDEWVSVLKGILKQMEVVMKEEEIKEFVNENIDKLRRNHSGSSMEMVIRAAYQRALSQDKPLTKDMLQDTFDNFKTNFNQKVYQLQTLLAISACNEISFIKKTSSEYSYGDEDIDKIVKNAIEMKSNEPLEERISKLKREVFFSSEL